MGVEYTGKVQGNLNTVLGAIGTLGTLSGNCGNGGLLGNLLGGGHCHNGAAAFGEAQYVSDLQAKVARLESEKYSDINDKAVYQQTLADNRTLRDEMYNIFKPVADEAANNRVEVARLQEQLKCCCEKQELQAQITAGKINETALALNGKIDTMSANFNGAFNSLNQTISCIQNTVNSVTKVALDSCKLCPGVVYASQGVPATGTTWYPSCISPVAPTTTTTTTPAA